MAATTSALLFCPPQAPVSLSRETPLTIGRHSACGMTIPRTAVSRQHAEVEFADGVFRLRDLASRNGSFVNGQQIDEPVVLCSGDQIEIGPCTITFCEIQSGLGEAADAESLNDAQTVCFIRPEASSEAFHGDLSEIPAFAVLQVLEMGAKTGVLSISHRGESSRIWLVSGDPIHAETEKSVGVDAALSVVGAREGEFQFESQTVDREATIRASITELLLEACRLEDEAAR